jgi:hypothetical protein
MGRLKVRKTIVTGRGGQGKIGDMTRRNDAELGESPGLMGGAGQEKSRGPLTRQDLWRAEWSGARQPLGITVVKGPAGLKATHRRSIRVTIKAIALAVPDCSPNCIRTLNAGRKCFFFMRLRHSREMPHPVCAGWKPDPERARPLPDRIISLQPARHAYRNDAVQTNSLTDP